MKCYVTNYNDGVQLPAELKKDNTLFFPEKAMTTHDQLNSSQPRDYNIITDSVFLISLYDCNDVLIWSQEDMEWQHPNFQTYGSSFSYILRRIFGASEIPQVVLDGKSTNCMGHQIKPD